MKCNFALNSLFEDFFVLNNNNNMDPQDSTGTKIGKWEIRQKIGDGSFGNVYSATLSSETCDNNSDEKGET